MATFRSVLSRWIFAVAVFYGGFISLGAAFAPLGPSFQGSSDPVRLDVSVESRIISGPMEVKSFSRHNEALNRLGELVFTHHAISVSA